ncbi:MULTISPECIES: DUF6877 family protein [Bhargavaea]|uniref:DUF6877 family protein n=1 Tax=Bhargavaea changchunensis TaxID=2134037 RepID=A0ABW2NF48_9BACL
MVGRTVKQAIIQDALDRITDWVLSGGRLTDPYVQRQYAFVQEVLGREDLCGASVRKESGSVRL